MTIAFNFLPKLGPPLRGPFFMPFYILVYAVFKSFTFMDVLMSEIDTPYTNVTLQTFATQGDMALVNQQWEKLGPGFLERLKKNGLLSYEIAKIWNKDSKLMRFVIFRYKSADAFKSCQPIWTEIEKSVFEGAVVKVTAYRGITEEYWSI